MPDPVPLPDPLPPAEAGTVQLDPPLEPPVSAPPPELPVGPLPFEDPDVLPLGFGSWGCDDLPETRPNSPSRPFWFDDCGSAGGTLGLDGVQDGCVAGFLPSPIQWLAVSPNALRFSTTERKFPPPEELALPGEPGSPPICAPLPPALDGIVSDWFVVPDPWPEPFLW